MWVLGAAVVLIVAMTSAACSKDATVVDADRSTPDPALTQPGFHDLAAFPLSPRFSHAIVWTGTQLLVWGGQWEDGRMPSGRLVGDGAALDLAANSWAKVAASPFPHGLYQPVGAWDGTEAIIVGTDCDSVVPLTTDGSPPPCSAAAALAWNPAEDRWRKLPVPPVPLDRFYQQPIMGNSATVNGAGVAVFATSDGGAMVWDRTTQTWSTVAPPVAQPDPTPSAVPKTGTCADAVDSTLVAMRFSNWGGGATAESDMWVLDVAAHRWKPPVRSQVPIQMTPTCGAGHLATAGSVAMADGSRFTTSGSLVDVATGAAEEVYRDVPGPPRPELNQMAITGPWLMRSTMTVDGTLPGASVPTTTGTTTSAPESANVTAPGATPSSVPKPVNVYSVRLVGRPDWEPLGADPDSVWLSATTFVGSGTVSLSLSEKNVSPVYWRAPSSLLP